LGNETAFPLAENNERNCFFLIIKVAEDQAPYGKTNLKQTILNWQKSSVALSKSMDGLFDMLEKDYPWIARD